MMANESADKLSSQNGSYSINNSSSDVVEDVLLPVFYSLIVFVGVIGNSLVITIVMKTSLMQSTTNLLLANLAAADLLALISSVPNEVLLQFDHPAGTLGTYLCVFLSTGNTTVMCLFVSILVLTVLAIERLNGVVKPFNTNRALTKQKVAFAVGAIWMMSVACTIPLFTSTIYSPEDGWCMSSWDSAAISAYVIFVLIGFFLVPLVVISFSYISVIRELYFKQEGMPEGNSQSDIRSKKRVVKLLLLVTAVFGVSFGTFGICRFLFENDRVGGIVYNISVLLLYSSCSANPVIYAFQSPNYRKAFKQMLGLNSVHKRTTRRSRASTRPSRENIEM